MRLLTSARLPLAACLLGFFSACSKGKTIPVWANAKKEAVTVGKDFDFEQNGLRIEGRIDQRDMGLTLDLVIVSTTKAMHNKRLAYEDLHAFWDNQELPVAAAATSTELPIAKQADGSWRASVKFTKKVQVWPEHDVVYLAVGPALWQFEVSPP